MPGSAYNAAASNILNPSTKAGGTLRLLSNSDCDSWDPGKVTFHWCWNLQRLITRTLVGYTNVNTQARLGPDLANSLGHHNADYTAWTYRLKHGLDFANGAPITPQDVKYGIERDLSRKRQDGIRTITTTGTSITFNLSGPDAEFDYLMALPASAPVPNDGDPVATGPFEIASYQPKKSVVFVRNPHWRQSTDDIRHPLVNKIVLTVVAKLGDIDQRLQAGTADARADGGVQDAFGSKILRSPKLKQYADDPALPVTQYVEVTPSVIPNIHCRRAIFYAWNKAASDRVFGAPTDGVPADSMTPPGIEGHDAGFDPYPSGAGLTGDVTKARQELRRCGKPNGFSTRMVDDLDSATDPALFAVEQRALGRVGIKLTRYELGPTGLFIFTGSPAQLKDGDIGLWENNGTADYPTAYAFYKPIAYYHSTLPSGAPAGGSLSDPAIQDTLDGKPKSETAWRNLDQAVMADALFLPFQWQRVLEYRNPRMTNVTCDLALASGSCDFVNVGVR